MGQDIKTIASSVSCQFNENIDAVCTNKLSDLTKEKGEGSHKRKMHEKKTRRQKKTLQDL